MANATDLITYIGVPLTVAGVIPLLWNMVVAIQIWLRLRASIPPSIRKYYSLIIDPAAGQVTVVARMPTLSSPGQWMASRPDVDKKSLDQESTTSFSWPPAVINAAPQKPLRLRKRARNHVTTRLASVISTRILTPFGMPPEVLMQSMTQAGRLGDITGGGKFAVTRSKLLHRPWMSLIEHCKLIMRPTDEMDDDQREEVRFTVQSDMKASDFTPLMMTWSHFAWICLALNVGAYDPLWQSSIPYTIKNGEGKDLIKLFEDNDRLCARLLSGQEVTYITHRALSWYNVAFNGEVLFPLGCGALSQVPISSVNISTELSAPSLPQKHARKARERAQIGVVRGKEPQECEHPLAAACYWMLYRRDFPAGWITVSQQMLEYRERVLCYLQHLDDHGMLLDRLVCIMTAGPRQNDALKLDDKKGAVSPPDATARPNLLKTSETSKEAHIDFVSDGSPVLQMSDKGEAAVDVSTHPTGKEGTTDPVQSADDRTNQLSAEFPKGAVATKQASAAFGVDREAMSYRDDDSAIRKARSDDADVNGEWRFRDRRRLAQPEIIKAHHVRVILRSHFESSAYVQRYQYLALMRQQLLPFISNKFMGGADHKTHSKEVLADSARDLLQPLEHSMPQHVHIQTQTNTYDSIDPKRRERFELAVRSYMISPTASDLDWGDEAGNDEGEFLAYVALALANWANCAHQPWMPQPELQSLARACGASMGDFQDRPADWYKSIVENSIYDAIYHTERPVGGFLDCTADSYKDIDNEIIDLLTNVRKDGLYTAPESPVPHLMRKNDRDVYLL